MPAPSVYRGVLRGRAVTHNRIPSDRWSGFQAQAAYRPGSASSATSGFTSVSTQALVLSSSIAMGDMVLVAVAVAGSGSQAVNTISLSGGNANWQPAGTFAYGGGSAFGTTVTLAVFSALAIFGTSGATVTATIGTAGAAQIAAAAYPGAQIVDVYAPQDITAGGTTLPEGTGSQTYSGEMLVNIAALWTASTATVAMAQPADTPFLRTHTGDTDFQWLGIADSTGWQQGAGPVGGGSWNWAGSAVGCSALVALTSTGAVPSTVPYVVGMGGGTGNVLIIPVIRNMSPGDQIGIWTSSMSGAVAMVTDTRGNSYTFVSQQTTSNNSYYYQAEGTPTPLQIGDSVTVTRTGGSNFLNGHIIGLPGLVAAPVDAARTTASGTSTGPTATTGTLAQASEYVLMLQENASGGGVPIYTSPWIISDTVQGGGGGSWTSWAYQVVTATTALTASSTIASAAWELIVIPLEQSAATVSRSSTMTGTGTLGESPYFDGSGTALSGAGTLGGLPYFDGTPTALSGAGSLAAAPVFTTAAAMSGVGTITVSGAQLSVSASLTGLGSLTASPVLSAAAALSGLGSLAAAPYFAGAAAMSGAGTLAALWTFGDRSALTGLGSLAGSPIFQAAAAMSGLGSLTAAPYFAGALAMSGSGTLSAAPVLSVPAVLSGVGVIGTAPFLAASAALSGLGTLGALWTFGELSAMSGLGTLTGAYSGSATGSAGLSGLGTLTASPVLSALAGLTGQGTLAGLGQLAGAAGLTGLGSLTGQAQLAAASALSGLGTLTGAPLITAAASLSGLGTLSGAYASSAQASAVLSGLGTLTGTPVLVVQGFTGTTDWEAGPTDDRWSAVPALPRWLAGLLTPRWQAAVHAPRWLAAPAPPRWEIMMATFAPISALSLEEINITWTSDLDGTRIDPSSLTVEFAVPVSSGVLTAPAQPVTWYAASWLAGGSGLGWVAQGLVGPGGAITLAAGLKYDVWGKILGSPEQPVKFVGVQAVY